MAHVSKFIPQTVGGGRPVPGRINVAISPFQQPVLQQAKEAFGFDVEVERFDVPTKVAVEVGLEDEAGVLIRFRRQVTLADLQRLATVANLGVSLAQLKR